MTLINPIQPQDTKADLIVKACLKETSINPFEIFRHIADSGITSIHGPEHHILDGACILTAYKNAGGKIELDSALEKMKTEGLKMPGAICGLWGVCGAVLSVGCALSIIEGTGPLSSDGSWGRHMEYTSKAIQEIGKTKGPRCCKRDGFIALKMGAEYIRDQLGVILEKDNPECPYSSQNQQCIKESCPFFKE